MFVSEPSSQIFSEEFATSRDILESDLMDVHVELENLGRARSNLLSDRMRGSSFRLVFGPVHVLT